MQNYLAVLEATFVAHVVRPFSSHASTEIVAAPTAIECKWRAGDFDPSNPQIFRRLYPQGANYVVTSERLRTRERVFGGVEVTFIGLDELTEVASLEVAEDLSVCSPLCPPHPAVSAIVG